VLGRVQFVQMFSTTEDVTEIAEPLEFLMDKTKSMFTSSLHCSCSKSRFNQIYVRMGTSRLSPLPFHADFKNRI